MSKRASKYGNVRTNGFASKKEARRYQELQLLEKAGAIRELRCQPKFPLFAYRPPPAIVPELIGSYIGDFAYEDGSTEAWNLVVEDAKGFRTELYRWKKKHVEAQYGITIREV